MIGNCNKNNAKIILSSGFLSYYSLLNYSSDITFLPTHPQKLWILTSTGIFRAPEPPLKGQQRRIRRGRRLSTLLLRFLIDDLILKRKQQIELYYLFCTNFSSKLLTWSLRLESTKKYCPLYWCNPQFCVFAEGRNKTY